MLRRFTFTSRSYSLSSSCYHLPTFINDVSSFKLKSSSNKSNTGNKNNNLDAIIGKCVSTNDYQRAISTIEEFILVTPSNQMNQQQKQQTIEIPLSVLKATLFICEKNQQYQKGLDLANKLHQKGFLSAATKWDESSLSTILRLQCHVNDLKGAEWCFGMILGLAQQRRDRGGLKRRSVAPLVACYYRNFCNRTGDAMATSAIQSHTRFLAQECRKYNVELLVEDLYYFTKILLSRTSTRTNPSPSTKKLLQKMLYDFIDHSPILCDLDDQGKPPSLHQQQQDLKFFEEILVQLEARDGEEEEEKNRGQPQQQPNPRHFIEAEIDPKSASCSVCNCTLDATPMTKTDRERLRDDIENILIEHACHKNPKKFYSIRAGFKSFQSYCRNYDPDVLIDGANLGFFGLSSWYHIAKKEKMMMLGQNTNSNDDQTNTIKFDKKSMTSVDVPVNLHFVDLAVKEMEKLGKKPLVVLHERHLEKKNLLPSYLPIVDEWLRKKRCVFATPSGLNDDICWLWRIVSADKNCLVLTNDAMRDHHFALLSRRAFLRMRDRKQMTFSAKWTGSETQLFVRPPPVYSSVVQRNSNNTSTTSDIVDETKKRTKWHIPYYEYSGGAEEVVGEDGEEVVGMMRKVKWKCF